MISRFLTAIFDIDHRGDLRQLAPRKKLLKSCCGFPEAFGSPAHSEARGFSFAPLLALDVSAYQSPRRLQGDCMATIEEQINNYGFQIADGEAHKYHFHTIAF